MFDPALAELVDQYWFAVLRRALERQSIWELPDYGPVYVNNSEDSSIQGYRKMLCDRLGLRHTEYRTTRCWTIYPSTVRLHSFSGQSTII